MRHDKHLFAHSVLLLLFFDCWKPLITECARRADSNDTVQSGASSQTAENSTAEPRSLIFQ